MARIVKQAGHSGWSQRRFTMHGSSAERSLMAGKGSFIRQSTNQVGRVKVTGEKPGNLRGNRRP